MLIKNIKEFGISQGLLREGKKGINYLLPVFKRFLNYLGVPWTDTCCGDSGTAAPTTGSSQDLRPYKVYTALLTQTGTDAPVVDVLENTLGVNLIWTRQTAGNYITTLTNQIAPFNKTYVMFNNSAPNEYSYVSYRSGSQLNVESKYQYIGVDNNLYLNSLEVRVYN